MKNLTIHRLALGMLTAFVLAFSVQGIAEAQTVSVSGDTAVKGSATGTAVISVADISNANTLERSFTLRVTNAKDADDVALAPTNALITQIKVTSAPSDPASDPDDGSDPEPSPAKDAIVSGNTITFGGLGTKNDNVAGSTTGDPNTASWTFKVTYTVAQLGLYSIDADHNDPNPDIEAYVVRSKGKAASYELDKATAGDITQTPQESGNNIVVQVVEGTTIQPWVQVDVSISGGKLYPKGQFLSGSRIYELNDANDNGYTSLSVFTDDADGKIDVQVNPNRDQTAMVTAKISGVSGDHASHTVTYFYNDVKIERVSGNYQHARTGDSLPQPLVVRVLDGSRKIRDQRVRFTATGGRLYATSSSDLIPNESGSAEGTTVLSVKTNSSGEAKVDLRVPAAAGVVTVNAVVAGTPPAPGTTLDELGSTDQFTVFAAQRTTGTSTITASTSTPLESSDPNYNPLYFTTSTPATEVEFTITGGQLYLKPELLDLDGGSLGQRDDKPKYVSSLKISSDVSNQIGTAGSPILFARVTSGVATVTARIPGSSEDDAEKVIQIIAGNLDLIKVSNNQRIRGALGGLRSDPFVVRVLIGNSPASGQIVKFTHTQASSSSLRPVPGTKVFVTSAGGYILDNNTGPRPASTSVPVTILREETYTVDSTGQPIFVETDSNGEAQVYLQMGTTANQSHTVTATLPVGSETVSFTVQPQGGTIEGDLTKIDVPDLRPNNDKIDTLAIRAENVYGDRLPNVNIRFTTTHGTIIYNASHGTISDNTAANPPTTVVDSGQEIFVLTDSYGEVWVLYRRDPDVSKQTVRAEIASEQGTQQYDFEVRYVTFNIGSGGSTTTPTTTQTTTTQTTTTVGGPTDDDPVPDEIEIVSGNDGQTGTPGSELSNPFVVQVVDSDGEPIENVRVYFDIDEGGGSLSRRSQRTDADGEAETTLTLGPSPGENTVTVTLDDDDLDVDDVEFTATAIAQPESIAIVSGNNQTGTPNRALAEAFVVKVTDVNGNPVENVTVTFRVRSGPGRFPGGTRITDTTNSRGEAESQRLFLTETAFGTVRVTAEVGGAGSVDFTVNAGDPPDAIVSVSGNNQNGAPGSKLKNPFVVEVLDEDDNPMSDVTVTFKVTAGGGKVSPASATTDSKGLAKTTLTLGEERGNNTVVASVAGLSRTVTFKAKASAVVLVDAADRPPLYWIDRTNGTLHRLVAEETEDLASNMKGATNIAVDSANGYIYWIAQTGENKGAIRRAGLNGKGAQTLKAVSSLPMGIAVDGAGGTVYWTNARGKLLSMPVSGGKVTNVTQNLSSPGPIALSNGVLYWGEATGSVRKMSLTAKPKKIENLATGLGEPLAIAIAKGKIYWIERGGGGSGKLQRANTSGAPNIRQLKSFASGVPIGLTADSSANKLYWTKRTGKIQRSNFAGKFIKDVVTGLSHPGAIALGTASVSTTSVTQGNQQTNNQQANNQQTNTQQTTYSMYDVNKDGAVDNKDTRLVAAAVGQSGAAITNARTDVDGSGTVDVTDLILVLGNLDDEVAAPAIDIDVKALDLDFDRVQEQVEMLLASGDRSIAAQRALLYLQHLLASARPDETVLLANYPNPFNPETWIPYHLAESTDVRVNIYDAQGTLVRALTLGHQTAGYYTSRSRAAYWDGRNALGERVASGVYFYQLQTDAISPMRKMVILK